MQFNKFLHVQIYILAYFIKQPQNPILGVFLGFQLAHAN